jgi:proteasome lid subunit RPN8/RPN11
MKIEAEDVEIQLTLEAAQRLRTFVSLAPYEISGLGSVTRDGNVFLVDRVYLLEQECSYAETTLDDKALRDFVIEGEKEEPGFSEGINLWFHSHADMGCFWSETDNATVERLKNESFLVSLVLNKKGDVRARIDTWEPLRVTLDKVPVKIEFPNNDLAHEECVKEFEDKVKTRSYASYKPRYGYSDFGCYELVDPYDHELPWDFEDPTETTKGEKTNAKSGNSGRDKVRPAAGRVTSIKDP